MSCADVPAGQKKQLPKLDVGCFPPLCKATPGKWTLTHAQHWH